MRLYAGRDLPRGRTWVDPYPTDHLFRARLAPGTRRVTVEPTDRFGRVRIATLA